MGKLLRPTCTLLAKKRITRIEDAGTFVLVHLRDMSAPLCWPKEISLYNLYMVISESLPDDWHYYEVPETRVEPGDVVLDCGAAEGLFSLEAMERARCIAVEPSPLFFECLERTFHRSDKVQIVKCALSSSEGYAYLSRGTLNSALTGGTGDAPAVGADEVRTVTVDRLVRELGLTRVDYIKGDLESFELEVLKGAERTIRDYMPKIAMTTYHPGNDWKEMRDYVLSLAPGYAWRVKGLSWSNEGPKPVMIHFWRPGRR